MRKFLISLGVCLIVFGVLLPVVAQTGDKNAPRKFTSEAVIEVKDPGPFFTPDLNPEPAYAEDQTQLLQSTGVLYRVIDQLGLGRKWFADGSQKIPDASSYQLHTHAYEKLLKMLTVIQKPDTGIIIIAATSTSKQEASDIVNAIAITYLNRKNDDIKEMVDITLKDSSSQVEGLRKAMKEAKAAVEKIRDRDGVSDSHPQTAGAPVSPANARYEEAKKNYIAAMASLDQAEKAYESAKIKMKSVPVFVKVLKKAEPAR